MNKLYSVHDHWTDINKKNDVDIESIDGVITVIKVNGEDYGGSTWTQVFTGNVATSGEAAPFSGTINAVLSGADTIKVFYNDGVYILPKQITDDGIYYGATPGATPSDIDFSEIPFLIMLGEANTALYTQSPGPQNITILEPQSGGGSNDFSTAEVTLKTSNISFRGFVDYLPVLESDGLTTLYEINLEENAQVTIAVALYKGKTIIPSLGMGIKITDITGNITEDEEGYIITGDCSITLVPMD